MEWKRALRRALRDHGHIPQDMLRVSKKHKNLTLASQPNEYAGGCEICSLRVEAFTSPGTPVAFKLTAPGTPVTLKTLEIGDLLLPECIPSRSTEAAQRARIRKTLHISDEASEHESL